METAEVRAGTAMSTETPVPALFQRLLMDSEAEIRKLLLLQQDHAGGGKQQGEKQKKNRRVFEQGGVEILQMSVRQKLVTASKQQNQNLFTKLTCHPLPKSCWNSPGPAPTSPGPVPTYLFFLVFFSAALSPVLIKEGKEWL